MAKRIKIEDVWNGRITNWDNGRHGFSQYAKIYALGQDGRVWLHQPFGSSATEVYSWEGTIKGLIAKMQKVGSIDPDHWKCVDYVGDAGLPDWALTTASAEYMDANS